MILLSFAHVKIFKGNTLGLLDSFIAQVPGQRNSTSGIFVGGG